MVVEYFLRMHKVLGLNPRKEKKKGLKTGVEARGPEVVQGHLWLQ